MVRYIDTKPSRSQEGRVPTSPTKRKQKCETAVLLKTCLVTVTGLLTLLRGFLYWKQTKLWSVKATGCDVKPLAMGKAWQFAKTRSIQVAVQIVSRVIS